MFFLQPGTQLQRFAETTWDVLVLAVWAKALWISWFQFAEMAVSVPNVVLSLTLQLKKMWRENRDYFGCANEKIGCARAE